MNVRMANRRKTIPFNPEAYAVRTVRSYEELRALPRHAAAAMLEISAPPGVLEGPREDLLLYPSTERTFLRKHVLGGGWIVDARSRTIFAGDSDRAILEEHDMIGGTKVSRRAFVAPDVIVEYGSVIPPYAKVYADVGPNITVAAFARVNSAYIRAQRSVNKQRRNGMALYYSSLLAFVGSATLLHLSQDGKLLAATAATFATGVVHKKIRKHNVDLLARIKLEKLVRRKRARNSDSQY